MMRTASNTLPLRDESRNMGIFFPGSKGAGKSRIMGRLIAWEDFCRGIPLVIIDPFGKIVENFLDKFCRLPVTQQRALQHRIVYIDTAGHGEGRDQVVAPFPLLYRTGNESLDVIARRHAEFFIRFDPELRDAPIMGANPLSKLGREVGVLLAAMNRQIIPEGVELVRHPERWLDQVRQVQERYPRQAGQAAAAFLGGYVAASKKDREMTSNAYLTKLGELTYDPLLVAQFGAMEPHFRFEEIEEHHLAVLINLGGEPSPELRRLKMLWLYLYLMEYVARRDKVVPNVRAWPLSIFIDELTFILGKPNDPDDPLAQDLERLLNLYSRNNYLWVCLALQEMYQVSEQLQKTLMTLGTQIIGQTTDDESALALARRFNRYEPLKVKKYEDQWATDFETGEDYVRSKRPVELTFAEQERINANKYKQLSTLRFMVGVSPREGTPATDLSLVDLNDFERGAYPVLPVVREAQAYFMQRDGRRVVEVLEEIEQRGKQQPPPTGTLVPRPKNKGPRPGGAQRPPAEGTPLPEETEQDTTPERPVKRPTRPLDEEELTEPL